MNLIQRLIAFYHESKAGSIETMSTIWKNIVTEIQKPLVTALEKKDEEGVSLILNRAAPSFLVWGLEAPNAIDWNGPAVRRLSRRMGVIPLENPEQDAGSDKIPNGAELKRIMEEHLGVSMDVPDIMGYKGVPMRFLFAWSAAYSLRSLPIFPRSVLEIGAGLAFFGCVLRRLSTIRYVVIDLPTNAVMGAFYLAKAIGEENVWLYGESRPNAYARFYPSTHYEDVREMSFDLAFNSDSFPEMPTKAQDDYLRLIARTIQPYGKFLSVNHESNAIDQRSVLSAVTGDSFPRLRLHSRCLFWMREGYVEEMYVPISNWRDL